MKHGLRRGLILICAALSCGMFAKEEKMNTMFEEKFHTESNGLPGGWYVEFNSPMKEVPAIRRGEKCIELLSAGNKFLPVTPDFSDGVFKTKLSFDFPSTDGRFGMTFFFRYDTLSGRGQAFRLTHVPKTENMILEYGTTQMNRFLPEAKRNFTVKDEALCVPFEVTAEFKGKNLKVSLFGKNFKFAVKEGSGKIAVSREHFFDVLKILAFQIQSGDPLKVYAEKRFTIPMPKEPTLAPLYYDVVLKDYGNCMDAELSLHGGAREMTLGEGNYSGCCCDILDRPFLKVQKKESQDKHVFHTKRIVMRPEGKASSAFYRFFIEKVDWPFCRTVRFMKPTEPFELALGFDSYKYTALTHEAQSPSATFFTTEGKVLYSGLDLTEGKKKITYHSQPEKEMLKRLPKTDPRYEKAVEFVKNNHYFFEGEIPEFSICVTGISHMPVSYEVILEDAFLRPVRKLKAKMTNSSQKTGLVTYASSTLHVEPLKNLACGVWHLRIRSTDSSVAPVENYCAFEVMSRKKDALPPPLISGLPFLYNARTETRNLKTDAFDPWQGSSQNIGHYVSCATFLPVAAREFDVFATVKAYGRQNFLWLGSRCQNDWSWKHNMDLIEKTDYVNMADELSQRNMSWQWIYRDFILEKLIEFAKKNDPEGLNVPALEKLLKEGPRGQSSSVRGPGAADMKTLQYLAEHHWEAWLDYINEEAAKRAKEILKVMRKKNPSLKYSQYGPAHIYAACLKGPEFIRLLQNGKTDNSWVGFWQYEDYPYSARYGLERSVYFLASCLMTLPNPRIYPEIYIDGTIGGNTDGALFYAHPPHGCRPNSYPKHMNIEILEFCYASGYLKDGAFHYWKDCGFQACRFTQDWYEQLLKTWGVVRENRPVRPVKGNAFVSSDASRRAAKNWTVVYDEYNIVDVRNTAAEEVPYLYGCARRAGLAAGFLLPEKEILALTPENTDVAVLPPLKGMSKASIAHLRKLHKAGVSLIACEDVSGMEDLFGVKDSGKSRTVTMIHAAGDFCKGMREFCDDERCVGKYEVTTAKILLDAEIPVMTVQKNGKASAVLFNVPPQMVKMDRLHQRFTISKEGISELMERAAAEIIRQLSANFVTSTEGRLMACYTEKNTLCVIVYNPSDTKELNPEIRIAEELMKNVKSVRCNHAYTELSKGVYRVRLADSDYAMFTFKLK